MTLLALILLAAPCDKARGLGAGEIAPCTGVLITTAQARQAVLDRKEVEVRRGEKCPEVTPKPCPKCPSVAVYRRTMWIAGSATAGVLIGVFGAIWATGR